MFFFVVVVLFCFQTASSMNSNVETVCVGLYQGGVMAHTTVMTSLTNHLIAVIVSFLFSTIKHAL